MLLSSFLSRIGADTKGGVRAELVIGITLGVILALVLIAVFVFGYSQESVDAPLLGD